MTDISQLSDTELTALYKQQPAVDLSRLTDDQLKALYTQQTGSTGTINALAGGAIEGVPILGPLVKTGAERAAAGIRSVMQGTPYSDELKAVQDYAAAAKTQHPVANISGQVAGGIGSLGGLGMTATGARLLGMTGSLPQMIGRGAASGAAINAVDAAIRGNEPVGAAALGGAVGAAAPVVGHVAGAVAAPIATTVRGFLNPTAEATRRVAGAVQRDVAAGSSGLTQPEFTAARAAGSPVNIMDLGGETTRALARSAANTSPEGRAILDRTINDRFEGQSNRLADWLRSTFNYPDAVAQQAALENTSRTVNRQAYRQAYDEGAAGLWSPELERLAGSNAVSTAMQNAAKSAKDEAIVSGYGAMNPRITFTEDGRIQFTRGPNGVPTYPDLQYWDLVRRELSDAAQRAGRGTSEARRLNTFASALNTELDRLVPSYRQARQGASSFFGAENALEAGQNFVTSKVGNAEARAALARMSPLERQLFQDGFVDRFVQQVRESPDRRSILNQIAASPAARERLSIALGPGRARELTNLLRTESQMDLARGAVQGNSTTARQLAELGLAGGAYTAGTGGNILNPDPTALASAALVYGAARGRHAINSNVSREVARLLTSQNTGLLSRLAAPPPRLWQSEPALAAIAGRGLLPMMTPRFQ